eukprot:TRINITY_DN9033_c0_g1_i3.p1 TRINITY_DN9033_c0_g1~~TRINITY_DN9033_c0_g1_i3.p1  ORF type:complete len:305 (-),score=-3.59 TRINITY_DN9033_c0_g1_i3:501-1415(-)
MTRVRVSGPLWMTEEDRILLAHVAKHGTRQWRAVISSGLLPRRDSKACCNRFIVLKRKYFKREGRDMDAFTSLKGAARERIQAHFVPAQVADATSDADEDSTCSLGAAVATTGISVLPEGYQLPRHGSPTPSSSQPLPAAHVTTNNDRTSLLSKCTDVPSDNITEAQVDTASSVAAFEAHLVALILNAYQLDVSEPGPVLGLKEQQQHQQWQPPQQRGCQEEANCMALEANVPDLSHGPHGVTKESHAQQPYKSLCDLNDSSIFLRPNIQSMGQRLLYDSDARGAQELSRAEADSGDMNDLLSR